MRQANMDANSPGKGRRRFSLRDLVVVSAIICVLLSLALPAVQVAREEARRLQCSNNLLQIGLALVNYHDSHGQFPSAYLADAQGQPRSSWRVAILPFISGSPFYDHYSLDEPWNSPSNLSLVRRNDGYFYHCPDDRPQEATTNYLAVMGAATAWPASASTRLQDFSNPSRSILVVESANTGIHWLEPRDLEFDELQLTIHAASWIGFSSRTSNPGQAISSGHPRGANVVFADGSLEFLATETSPELLKKMLVIGDSAPKISLGPRNRLRLVFDPDSTDGQHLRKQYRYKLEAYSTEEADSLNQ